VKSVTIASSANGAAKLSNWSSASGLDRDEMPGERDRNRRYESASAGRPKAAILERLSPGRTARLGALTVEEVARRGTEGGGGGAGSWPGVVRGAWARQSDGWALKRTLANRPPTRGSGQGGPEADVDGEMQDA